MASLTVRLRLVVCALAASTCAAPSAAPAIDRDAVRARPTPSALPGDAKANVTPWNPHRLHGIDDARRIDVNQLNLFVTNYGALAFDGSNGSPGLLYPKGTDKNLVYSAGLWLGARVNGQLRVTVAENAHEYLPGSILPGSIIDDPQRPEYIVYKMTRWTGHAGDSAHVERGAEELAVDPHLDPLVHHAWSEYLAGAAPFGAPTRTYRLPNTSTPAPGDSVDVIGPDVLGDQMLWAVFNDANPDAHSASAGGTAPLNVEVQQSVFGFDHPGPVGNTVFVRYRIINQGAEALQDLFVSQWADADVGTYNDDLAGCDPDRSLAFMFNGHGQDGVYGAQSPAVGFDLLHGRALSEGRPLHAAVRHMLGNEPLSAAESYDAMNGLERHGEPIVDPVSGETTRFPFHGDPVAGTGWIDTQPADRKLLLSAAPFALDPGDTAVVDFAIVVGAGTDFLSSVAQLRCNDDFIQSYYDSDFNLPSPPSELACDPVVECPRAASYWQRECAKPTKLVTDQLRRIANYVDDHSGFFDWPAGTELAGFTHAVKPIDPTTPRTDATREYVALLANVAAARLEIEEMTGRPIFLNHLLELGCPGIADSTIHGMIEAVDPIAQLRSASYEDDVTTHPVALEDIPANGLEAFNGGAGYGSSFLGSTLDPVAQPDSFATVEIRFSSTTTQKAYRFLRLERESNGAPPPQGRGYGYGGFHDVPFTAWDVERGIQLDCAFSERMVTDDAGVDLTRDLQPATQDSTWGPSHAADGGREYLFVFRHTYSGVVDTAFAQDGSILGNVLPVLYVLTAKKRDMLSVIDDGDRFRFVWGRPAITSIDADLFDLESRSLADPLVVARYQEITSCTQAVNQGIGIGAVCDGVTATVASLVTASASDGRVTLSWIVSSGGSFVFALERSTSDSPWTRIARMSADGIGRVAYVDRDVSPGERYGYRLLAIPGGSILDEVWVSVPGPDRLSLAGFRPNPATGIASVAFTLPSRSPASLEVLDVSGRRVFSREVGSLGPGDHRVPILGKGAVAAGVYYLRLRQAGRTEVARAVLLR